MDFGNGSHPQDDVRTVVVGGAAGDGVREAGINLAEFLHELGFESFFSFAYPSLIRGGHNFARVSFSRGKVHADHRAIDVLIAVNDETVKLHAGDLREDAVVFVETAYYEGVKALWPNTVPLPMKSIAEESKAPMVARTSSALGAFGYVAGLAPEKVNELAKIVFANVGADMNAALADKGYRHAEAASLAKMQLAPGTKARGELVEGNRAVGKGFIAAGLEFYAGYPMTPSTSLLHFLAKTQKDHGHKVIHPEDEISVINTALGIAAAGRRVAIGTATGGFALMQEAFSLTGISELPLALMVSQRKGPATGVATHTGQGELRFMLHAGHGEFPRIIIAPGDAEEAFYAGAAALNLAWKYQVPAVVLMDKHVSESASVAEMDASKIVIERGKLAPADAGAAYRRYAVTEDGVSPFAPFGAPNAVVKQTSYEHDELGDATEDRDKVKAMIDKRARKLRNIYGENVYPEPVKVYGEPASDAAVVFWGSTKGMVLEAAKYLKRGVRLVQVLWMEPFPTAQLTQALAGASKIIDVEGNENAQLAGLIREKTGIAATHTLLRYDAEPFEPTELAAQINEII